MMSRKLVKMAIAYDFDGTLAPGNMQQNSFLPMLEIAPEQFWEEVKVLAKSNDMNEVLAYMYLMLQKAQAGRQRITKDAFIAHGKGIELFPGLPDYFELINTYARERGIVVEHYIISSGLEDILKGTAVYKKFEKVFASSYYYDVNEIAVWPAQAVDYTNKTQFLFRINKGIKNAWDNHTLNTYMAKEERPIPFRRMIYLGDGETDIPAMKMTAYQGGQTVVVYNPHQRTNAGKKAKSNAERLMSRKRAQFIAPADYREGSVLFQILCHCIDKISAEVYLERFRGE